MTKKDIEVGAKYRNKLWRNVVFLGVGKARKGAPEKFIKKDLVIISNDEGCAGRIVLGVRQHSIKDMWKNFEKI